MHTESAEYWIRKLKLEKHPEGGYYREVYRSGRVIPHGALPEGCEGSRSFSTSIYFLLAGEDFSALHRMKSDEMWHFYAGTSLTTYWIDPSGKLGRIALGADAEAGEVFQEVVPAGTWFGAKVNDPASYSLMGCTVAPGFDFRDFELGKREILLHEYPRHARIIRMLTR